jgi:hypothetical protein
MARCGLHGAGASRMTSRRQSAWKQAAGRGGCGSPRLAARCPAPPRGAGLCRAAAGRRTVVPFVEPAGCSLGSPDPAPFFLYMAGGDREHAAGQGSGEQPPTPGATVCGRRMRNAAPFASCTIVRPVVWPDGSLGLLSGGAAGAGAIEFRAQGDSPTRAGQPSSTGDESTSRQPRPPGTGDGP